MGDQQNRDYSSERDTREEEDEPFPLTERDRIGILSKDEDFELHTWDALKEAIAIYGDINQSQSGRRYCSDGALPSSPTLHLYWIEQFDNVPKATNNLGIMQRKPSELRRYIAWCRKVKSEYGSISNYVIQHRLPWGSPPFTYLSSIPFSEPDDYKILINDWPYGCTDDITHIVVWSKTPIAANEATGDLTEESRLTLQNFVERTFVERLGGDHERVLWFKNWVQLQSVRALEHVHVLVRNATKEDLAYWTEKNL
ncbi:uncharacterized protein BP5553_07467 [Venustampulla echinocandica]|uniref:N-acetylglucosamine-induced protein 1 n=1 Tax=Venustampulla echinocandica TaxID=2656787 RepID=A0A370TGL5_9HELO|nr:uncharacterized protein BP5553_07467 [Venustampulla echinocandica]RDL34339.1 hypothetical protein BP5553_07467 [Venustampulla echinocandica]